MQSSNKKITHIVFSAIPAWGHVRSFCILAARLVKENENVVVTLVLPPNLFNKTQDEILAEFYGQESGDALRRVRVVYPFKSEAQDPFSIYGQFIQAYAIAYKTLTEAKSVSCAMTGQNFDAVPAPKIIILDFFAYPQMLATRAISGTSIPIVSWIANHAASVIRNFGPADRGGYGDLDAKIVEEVKQTGFTAEEIGPTIYTRTNGTIVKIPGIPDMYDWEYFAQELPFDQPMTDIIKAAQAGLKECGAALVASAYSFEKQSLEEFKSWLAEWNKKTYVIGPLLPSDYGAPTNNSRGSLEFNNFLDKALVEFGIHSVVFIGFGTMFWPAVQDYIEEVIEALIEKKFPFIISYASPFARISDDLVQKIKVSGLGLVSKWSPQQYILSHIATGWFMTHAGQNSVLESLGSGIPMICWPFTADQPAAAAHLTENLHVAFELLEVRSGSNGMKPLLRNGRKAKGTREAVGIEIREVIEACRGQQGEDLRKNAQDIQAQFGATWKRDGISRNEFGTFSKSFGLELL